MKLGGDQVSATISGGIVHDDDTRRVGLEEARQTATKPSLSVVGDNDGILSLDPPTSTRWCRLCNLESPHS